MIKSYLMLLSHVWQIILWVCWRHFCLENSSLVSEHQYALRIGAVVPPTVTEKHLGQSVIAVPTSAVPLQPCPYPLAEGDGQCVKEERFWVPIRPIFAQPCWPSVHSRLGL